MMPNLTSLRAAVAYLARRLMTSVVPENSPGAFPAPVWPTQMSQRQRREARSPGRVVPRMGQAYRHDRMARRGWISRAWHRLAG